MVHGGGVANFYNYGGNSPYIYVDPDGNIAQLILGAIGAAIGAVGGFVSGMVTGQGWKRSLAMAGVGAACGFVIGVTGGAATAAVAGILSGLGGASTLVAGAIVGAAMGAAAGFIQGTANAAICGANAAQSFRAGGSAAAWGAVTGAIGGAGGAALSKVPVGDIARTWMAAGAGASLSAQTTLAQTAINTGGDLSKASWDDIFQNYAINQTIAVAGSVANALASSGLSGGGTGEGGQPAASADASGGGGDFIESLPGMSDAELNAFVDSQPSRAKNNIAVYGQGGGLGAGPRNAAGPNGIYTPTGDKLVETINNSAAPIDQLDYYGHGDRQLAATDVGRRTDMSLYTDNFAANEKINTSLQGPASISDIDPSKFAPGAKINLYGCNMGSGNNSFAQQLADYTNRIVTAPNAIGSPQTGGMLYTSSGLKPGPYTEIKTFKPYWMK